MGHSPAQYMSIVFALLARGYTIEIKGVGRASYHATIRNQLDLIVGDLDYRCPGDGTENYASGISYGSYASSKDFTEDPVFLQIVERM